MRENTKHKGIYREVSLGKDIYTIKYNAGKNPITGKYIQKQERFQGTLADALKRRVHLTDVAGKRPAAYNKGWTVGQVGEAAFDDFSKSKNTVRIWRSKWNKLNDGFKVRKIEGVTVYELNEIINDLTRSGLTVATAKAYQTMIRYVFNWAVEQAIISESPAESMKKLKAKKPVKNRIKVDTISKVAKNLPEDHRDFFMMAMYLGARRSEVAALRVGDYDPSTGMITVERALEWEKDLVIFSKSTKNESERTFPLPLPARDIVERRLAKLKEKKPIPHTEDFLWSQGNTGQTPWRPDRASLMVRRTYQSVCPTPTCDYMKKRASKETHCPTCQVPLGAKVTIQNMRRFSTSALLGAKVNPEAVKNRGGWEKADVMYDSYALDSHADAELASEVLSRIGKDLFGAVS